MGVSQSNLSETLDHSNGPNSSTDSQINVQSLSRESGLECDTIQFIYTKLFQNQNSISKDDFMNYLSTKNQSIVKFNSILLTMFWNFSLLEEIDFGENCLKDGKLSLQAFICTLALLLGKHPIIKSTQRSRLVLESLSKSSETIEPDSFIDSKFTRTLFSNLIDSLYELFSYNFKNVYTLYEKSVNFIKVTTYPLELISFLFKENDDLSSNQIQTFFDTQFPRWIELIESFIEYGFFEPKEDDVPLKTIYSNTAFAPLVKDPPNFLSMKDIFHLVMSIEPSLKKGRSTDDIPVWDKLYNSSEHGFSLNRFETHVFKYPGPTLVFIRGSIDSAVSELNEQEIIMSAYVEEAWKKSKYAWGGKNTRVFELSPLFECFTSSGRRPEHIIFNSQIGIGFGPSTPAKPSTPGTFLLNLHSSLQTASYAGWMTFLERPAFKSSVYRNMPLESFSPGDEISINIDDIVVYGLGGEPARKRQNAEWAFEEADVNRRANISSFNNPHDPANRQILEMAGVISEDNPSIYRADHQES